MAPSEANSYQSGEAFSKLVSIYSRPVLGKGDCTPGGDVPGLSLGAAAGICQARRRRSALESHQQDTGGLFQEIASVGHNV